MKKEDIKNKYYDEFKISTKSRDKITKGVIEDLKNIPTSSIVDMDDWRIEKMKKEKTYFDLVKKIGIASLSIIATGAIVLGVMKYTEGKNNTKNAKESTTTEYSTENKNADDEEYVQVFKNFFGKIIEKSSKKTVIAQKEFKDYIIEVDGDRDYDPYLDSQTCMWLAIKGKNDKEFTEIKNLKFSNKDDVYSNGKYIITYYGDILYKYDIAKDKLETTNYECPVDSIDSSDEAKNNEYTGIYELLTVKNDKVYLVLRKEKSAVNDGEVVTFDVVSHDIKSGEKAVEIKKYKGSNFGFEDYEDYMVVQQNNDEDINVICLYSFTLEGLKKVKEINKNVEIREFNVGKVYYIQRKTSEQKEDEYEPLKNFTIYSYDIKTGKEENLGDIDIKDFGKGAYYFTAVDMFNEQWCEIVVNTKDYGMRSYKYTYATKKIEKLVIDRE